MRTLRFDKERRSRDAGRRLCRRPEGVSCAAANQSLPLRQHQKPAPAGFFVGVEVGDRPARLRRSFTVLRYATGITVTVHPSPPIL